MNKTEYNDELKIQGISLYKSNNYLPFFLTHPVKIPNYMYGQNVIKNPVH